MFDREEKQTELNKLLWKRALPLSSVIAVGPAFLPLGLRSYFNPELENCLGRVIEIETLGCPTWFSDIPLGFYLALTLVSVVATHYLYKKLAPQIKQVRADLADSSG